MKNIITENRIGKIQISKDFLHDYSNEELRNVLSNFIVVRAEYMFTHDAIEYVCYSQFFKVAKKQEQLKDYRLAFQKGAGQLKIQSVEEI